MIKAFAGLSLVLGLLACSGGGGGGQTPPPPPAAPVITQHPANASVPYQQPATFTVVASGSGLAYQWYKGAQPISNATADSLTLSACGAADVATYLVKVTNAGGTVQSNPATLTVTGMVAPAIATQPADLAVGLAQPVAFAVQATSDVLPVN